MDYGQFVCLVMITLVAICLYIISKYPYSYPSNHWLMLSMGIILYAAYLVYERMVMLPNKVTRPVRLTVLMAAFFMSMHIAVMGLMFGRQARVASVIINISMVLNGFLTAMLVTNTVFICLNNSTDTLKTNNIYTDITWVVEHLRIEPGPTKKTFDKTENKKL